MSVNQMNIGRMAESGYCSGLENRGRPKGRVGSNPTSSAQKHLEEWQNGNAAAC